MMAFSFEGMADVRRHADALVHLVRTGVPPACANELLRMVLKEKSASTIRQVATSASEFARKHRLGFLSKAYLANRVKWGLKELGYSDEFADGFTASVVVAMDGATRDELPPRARHGGEEVAAKQVAAGGCHRASGR